MNYEEALTEIKFQLKDVGDYDVVYWDCIPTAILKVCVEALEKQIPKKPLYKDKNKQFDGNWVKSCAKCGRILVERVTVKERGISYPIHHNRTPYCICGQAIDWEVKL